MKHVDYAVVGAGPAGLQIGYELGRRGRGYLVVEAGAAPGTFFERYPRHRQLISINKVHTGCSDRETNLRWDWNSLLSDDEVLDFTRYSDRYFPPADVYRRYLCEFAERHRLAVQYDTEVTAITRARDGSGAFLLRAGDREIHAGRLVVATGMGASYIPSIRGVEHAERYSDFSTSPDEYTGERVLVIGKGNSAFETADSLIEHAASIHLCSPSPIQMAWKSHYLGHLRAVNNNFLDTYQLKSQNAILDAEIDEIRKEGDRYVVDITYTHAMGEQRSIPFDRVLLCTGFRFDHGICSEDCRPELTASGRLPALTSEWESVNVPGMYFGGNLMHARDYKKTASGFIHGFRHNVAPLINALERRHHAKEWPTSVLPSDARLLAERIVARLNTSAALFLLNGFMCDVILAPEDGSAWRYVCDVPTDYAHDHPFDRSAPYYTVVLDYGEASESQDPFNVLRDPDPAAAADTYYLHPIIRRHEPGGRLVDEHHLVEDLENVYSEEKYVSSLADFFAAVAA